MGIGTTNQIGNITDIFGKIILESSTLDSLSRSPGYNFHTWPSRNRRFFLLRQVEFLHEFATPTWDDPDTSAATVRKMQIIEEPAEQGQHFMVGHPRGPLFLGCLGGTWLLHSTNCK